MGSLGFLDTADPYARLRIGQQDFKTKTAIDAGINQPFPPPSFLFFISSYTRTQLVALF